MGVYSSAVYGSVYGGAPPVTGVRRIVKLAGAARVLPRIKPGAFNTGVRGVYAGLTPQGSTTITASGAVLENVDLTGTLTIAADNVTVRNCRLRAVQNVGTYTVNWNSVSTTGKAPVGLVLQDVEIDGNGIQGGDIAPYPSGWAQSAAIQPGMGYVMRRCNVHGHTDNLKPQGNSTPILVEDSWLHDPVTYYSAAGAVTHNDITQIAGAGVLAPVTVRRSTLDGWRPNNTGATRYASSSGCQFGSFPANDGQLVDVIFHRNWIDGGSYVARFNASGLAVVVRTRFTYNRIGLHHQFGVFTGTTSSLDGGQITRNGNVWDVTGTTDYGLVVTAGQPVP